MPAAREDVRVYARSSLSVGCCSFTHRERLRTAGQFQRVFDRATKSGRGVFLVLSRENQVGYPRLGIMIAKRKLRRAVDRNLARRIVRESFRLNKTTLPTSDFVVILRRPVTTVQRDQCRRQLIMLWKSFAKS